MKDKIVEAGPPNVSNHIRDPKEINVVDIKKSSVPTDKYSVLEQEMKNDTCTNPR
jgi:hypothetical protein